jgi:hypothetical protein
MTVFGLVLTFGMLFAAASIIAGVLVHLVGLGVGFILLIIGTSTITAMLRNVDCGTAAFGRCAATPVRQERR